METTSTNRRAILLALGMLATSLAGVTNLRLRADEPKADAALERTREQVRMLDDLYKTAVVSVATIYDRPPAVKMAKQVFAGMEKKGWHSARLVDATGAPLGETNDPETPFEKKAAEAMKAGKTYYEEVVGEGDTRRLLAATVVPAVLPKCATCHGVKEGDLLGFIRYDVPVR